MRMLSSRLFAMCLAGVFITFVASSVFGGGQSCGDKAVKASGSSCCPASGVAMKIAQADGDCAVEAAAREYLAKVTRIGNADDGQHCPGTTAIKGLMAVLSEDEAYRPMVAQFEAFMRQQTDHQTVAMVKSSDCSGPCDGAKNAALAKGKSDCSQPCDGAKNAALASAKSGDCCGTCGGAKNAALAKGKSDCSQPCDGAKNAALASAKSGDCWSACAGAKGAALASVKSGDCAQPCDGDASPASYLAFGCTKCDDLARTAAEAYLSIMMEIKKITGAEGCPLEAADRTLAAVMRDMHNATQADAGDTGATATTVNLSTVSEKQDDCRSTPCEAVTKK